MRKVVLLALFNLLPLLLSGQELYKPFLEEGKVWTYRYYNGMTGRDFNESLAVNGDTIIGNKGYKRIVNVETGDYRYGMREEGQRVFVTYPNISDESLLYDFGLNVGDALVGTELTVVAVDTIVVGNHAFRALDIRTSGDEWPNWWVEGIGGMYYLTTNIERIGNNYSFSSCQSNGEMLFTNKDFQSLGTTPSSHKKYDSVVSESRLWTMDMNMRLNPKEYNINWETEMKLAGDTLINGINFMRRYYRDWQKGEEKPERWITTNEYVGQDGSKVYIYDDMFKTMKLDMDFSLNVGDKIVVDDEDPYYFYFVVTAASDTILDSSTDRTPRRCLHVQMEQFPDVTNVYDTDIWIEGIGSLTYAVSGVKQFLATGGADFRLTRCTDGDAVLYQTGSGNNNTQEYYPEGTKWTEIRLDTLKYDSWYSKVGDEWVSNFETIEYYVKGEYIDKSVGDGDFRFKCVYTNGPEWTDSLTLMLQEGDVKYVEPNCVMVSVFIHGNYGSGPLFPALAYDFDWSVGKGIYFENLLRSNLTGSFYSGNLYYGIIDEIKEGYFGGVRPLKYVDLDGKAPANDPNSYIINSDTKGGRIIQGIGITEWNNGVCLFGPPNPYHALQQFEDYHLISYPDRHRSMLVHFERNGEVLYDVWPEKETTNGMKSIIKEKTPITNTLYDLSGRRVQGTPKKGVYIQNGSKVVIK